jgi:hypothetical protein
VRCHAPSCIIEGPTCFSMGTSIVRYREMFELPGFFLPNTPVQPKFHCSLHCISKHKLGPHFSTVSWFISCAFHQKNSPSSPKTLAVLELSAEPKDLHGKKTFDCLTTPWKKVETILRDHLKPGPNDIKIYQICLMCLADLSQNWDVLIDSRKILARFEASILEASLRCIELVQTHLRFLHCTWLNQGWDGFGAIVDLGPYAWGKGFSLSIRMTQSC